jgi:hypothetical protein
LAETPTLNCCEKTARTSKGSEILYRLDSTSPKENKKVEKEDSKILKYFKRLNRFTNIPRVLFFYDVVSII